MDRAQFNKSSERLGTLRARLWRGGLAFALVALIFAITGQFRHRGQTNHPLIFGHDLLPSYAAGVLIRHGRADAMYEKQVVQSLEVQVAAAEHLDIDARFAPWLNPPFFAWVFVPLAALPYRQALGAFVGINLLLIAISFALLRGMLCSLSPASARPTPSKTQRKEGFTTAPACIFWKTFGLVPLLLAASMPFIQAFGHQQNSFLTLLILCITVTFWRSGAPFPAGLVAGLLAFKPQHAVLICGLLTLTLGLRALAGIAVTGCTLLLITLITLPGCLHSFVHGMPTLVAAIQTDAHYNWGRQVTFTSFWRLPLQGDRGGPSWPVVQALTWVCCGAFALMLLRAAIQWVRFRENRPSPDRLIGAAIASAPLILPYYMDYDLVLLVIPAVLLAARWNENPSSFARSGRFHLLAWIALFLASYVNPGFAREFQVNLTVLALVFVAGLQLRDALLEEEPSVVGIVPALA